MQEFVMCSLKSMVLKRDALRTLTTESLAVFIPFRVQEIYHENGVYYGQNVISKNMIIANRRQLLNGNSFILGVSGAGTVSYTHLATDLLIKRNGLPQSRHSGKKPMS